MAFSRDRRDRIKGGTSALLVQLVIGYALFTGLHVSLGREIETPLKLFDIAPPPAPAPPPPAMVKTDAAPRKEGRASPANLRARPKEVVAPPPIVTLPLPPPMSAPPVASTGNAARAGATDRIGPGTGAGGIGDGLGSGGKGDGDGGGGAGYGETPPRWVGGRITGSDYPEEAGIAGEQGTVGVRYVVRLDGRVGDCEITRSSGSTLLDRHTCALIQRRFRFRPSRDGRGRPIESQIVENHSWGIHDLPPARRRRGREDW